MNKIIIYDSSQYILYKCNNVNEMNGHSVETVEKVREHNNHVLSDFMTENKQIYTFEC